MPVPGHLILNGGIHAVHGARAPAVPIQGQNVPLFQKRPVQFAGGRRDDDVRLQGAVDQGLREGVLLAGQLRGNDHRHLGIRLPVGIQQGRVRKHSRNAQHFLLGLAQGKRPQAPVAVKAQVASLRRHRAAAEVAILVVRGIGGVAQGAALQGQDDAVGLHVTHLRRGIVSKPPGGVGLGGRGGP